VAVAGISQALPAFALADDAPALPDEEETMAGAEAEVETEAPGVEVPGDAGTGAGTGGEAGAEGDAAPDDPDAAPGTADNEEPEAPEDQDPDNQDGDKGGLEPLANVALLPESTYLIRSALADTQVLDIAAGSKNSMANVQLYVSNMTGAQSFALSYDEQGYATFTNTQSGKVLDVAGANTASGTNVWQYTPNNTNAQKWVIEAAGGAGGAGAGGATYTLRSALGEDLLLDVAGANTANGTNIQVYKRNGTKAQAFYFIDLAQTYVPKKPATLAPGDYIITSALSASPSPVLDIPGASHASGLQLQLYAPNGTFAQMFRASFDGTYYTLRSLTSGKTLTAANGNRVATTAVVQESDNPALLSQKWALEDNGDGTLTFISAASGLALDAAGANTANGTRIQLYTPNGTPAQRFRLGPPPADIIPNETLVSFIPYSAADKRIDIAAASRQSGAAAQIYASNDTLAQKFLAVAHGNNVFSFAALCSGQLLSLDGDKPCQQPLAASLPAPSQLWKVERALGGITLTNQGGQGGGRRLAVANSTLVGAAAGNATSQCFNYHIVTAIAPGTYTFTSKNGLALDITGASTSNGALAQLYTPNGTPAQKFKVEAAANGTISIKNCRSEKAITVDKTATTNGTTVSQQSYQGGANQRFTLVPSGDGYLQIRSSLSPFTYLAADRNASEAKLYSTTDAAKALSFSYQSTTYIKADKWIALTFDDGPSAYTENLLNELKKRDVHVTFFIVGAYATNTKREWLFKRMSDEGHEIGNHTWGHNGAADVLIGSLQATDDLVRSVTGKTPALMRPPGGGVNAQTRACGKPIILWSIDPRDWENRNGTYIYNHVVNNAQSGSIVLLHDSHSTTIPAALKIIDTLKARGYAFVTVSQMLGNAKPNTIYRSGPSTVGSF
jgi:peptidoglycan/xylan/chitin deacetylase (PgdA/CDA1 family)